MEWESSLPIEIELVAFGGKLEPDMPSIEYLTPPGMTTPTIYSRVARTNHEQTIYISGLFGDGDGRGQTFGIFAHLSYILRKSGSDFRHLAKGTYYVSDDESSKQLNELRPMYYDPKRPPAASKALVKGVGWPGKTITLDMIAVPGTGESPMLQRR